MYKLYYLVSPSTSKYYIGITKRKLSQRFSNHKHSAKVGKKSPIYDAMRKYGDFTIKLVSEFQTEVECINAEIKAIEEAKGSVYNLHKGGHIGFDNSSKSPEEVLLWKKKMSVSRQGAKPALGMRHSEETKQLCGEYSKSRWDLYGRYPEDVIKHSFKDAHNLYGISRTHYYRMRRIANDDA